MNDDAGRLVTTTAGFDDDADAALRPRRLNEFLGQRRVVDQLSVYLQAARGRGEACDHILLAGPPGLGKTSLAYIVAAEMDAVLHSISGPALDKKGDIAALLSALAPRDVLFIDEVHRTRRDVEEMLYPAMGDRAIDIVIGSGPGAKTLRLELQPFTLIAATTRSGLLSTPLRDRFGITFRLEHYPHHELIEIVQRSARLLGMSLDADAAGEVARRARGTPRVANRLLRRIRDYAQVHGLDAIGAAGAGAALDFLEVDHTGLDHMDRVLLRTIGQTFRGGPVGLQTLAVALGEDAGTIEEVYEPYLIQQGLVQRTARGRVLTQRGFDSIGVEAPDQPPSTQAPLFGTGATSGD